MSTYPEHWRNQLVGFSPFQIAIKWEFKGGVGALQKMLTENPGMDAASSSLFIESSPDSVGDVVKAYCDGQETTLSGRITMMVER